jgi:hypothetical protein
MILILFPCCHRIRENFLYDDKSERIVCIGKTNAERKIDQKEKGCERFFPMECALCVFPRCLEGAMIYLNNFYPTNNCHAIDLLPNDAYLKRAFKTNLLDISHHCFSKADVITKNKLMRIRLM